jgi:hypothetical protein
MALTAVKAGNINMIEGMRVPASLVPPKQRMVVAIDPGSTRTAPSRCEKTWSFAWAAWNGLAPAENSDARPQR